MKLETPQHWQGNAAKYYVCKKCLGEKFAKYVSQLSIPLPNNNFKHAAFIVSMYYFKDYYIDGLHTLTAKIGTMSAEGGPLGTQITAPGWIFWTMIFYNLKKFTSRSI